MEKKCPRCHSYLECNGAENRVCLCSQVILSQETRDYLQKTNYDCLCNNCLVELNSQVELSRQYTYPILQNNLEEGIHYYQEGPYMVMTELYHIIRGYCCRSGCRHCAYGFQKD